MAHRYLRRYSPLSRSAFTLIELLVVVAIISILASILLPVLGRAKSRAMVANCASNQKQVVMGIQEYADDWDEWTMPTTWTTNALVKMADGSDPTHYFGSRDIVKCPTWEYLGVNKGYASGSFGGNGLLMSYRVLTYGYAQRPENWQYFGNFGDNNYFPGTTTNQNYRAPLPNMRFLNSLVKDMDGAPALPIRYFGADQQPASMDGINMTSDRWIPYATNEYMRNNHVNLSGMNVSFYDGHVTWSNRYTSTKRWYAYSGGGWHYFEFY